MVLAGSCVAAVLHSFTVSNQHVWTFLSKSLQPSVKYVSCFKKHWNKHSFYGNQMISHSPTGPRGAGN